MNITTVGIKAELVTAYSQGSLGAGASLTLGTDQIYIAISLEAVAGNMKVEMKDHDGSTWDELASPEGTLFETNSATNPISTQSGMGTGTRIRNASAGALERAIIYWKLQ